MKTFLVLVVLTVGLSVGGAAWWGHQEPAVAATHDRAVLLFDAMETYPGTTALDQALEARRNGRVRVMVARDTAAGREIVLAVTASSNRRNNLDWWPSQGASYAATRCYRWTEDRDWGTADRVACPSTRDVDPARAPRAQPMGQDVADRLARALRRGEDPTDLPGAQVASDSGAVGVAVAGIRGYDSGRRVNDCLLGLRRADGTVQVWKPSSVQVAPGEASCDAATALAAGLQRPPH